MKQIFLLKPWQLFLILALSFIPVSPFREIFAVISTLTTLAWVYSIAVLGQRKLREDNLPTMDPNRFILTLCLVPIFVCGTWITGSYMESEAVITIIAFVVFNLLTIFSVFYLYYFASKTIALLELKRNVTWKESMKNFIIIGFPLVGVWFIQSKMKHWVFSETNEMF